MAYMNIPVDPIKSEPRGNISSLYNTYVLYINYMLSLKNLFFFLDNSPTPFQNFGGTMTFRNRAPESSPSPQPLSPASAIGLPHYQTSNPTGFNVMQPQQLGQQQSPVTYTPLQNYHQNHNFPPQQYNYSPTNINPNSTTLPTMFNQQQNQMLGIPNNNQWNSQSSPNGNIIGGVSPGTTPQNLIPLKELLQQTPQQLNLMENPYNVNNLISNSTTNNSNNVNNNVSNNINNLNSNNNNNNAPETGNLSSLFPMDFNLNSTELMGLFDNGSYPSNPNQQQQQQQQQNQRMNINEEENLTNSFKGLTTDEFTFN